MIEKIGIKIGEKIEVIKEGKSYKGILMPRPEFGCRDCIVIKLDNGYNIGLAYPFEVKRCK